MTVAFESGYSLPGGDMPLNHARILHRGVSHIFTVDDAGTTAVASATYSKNAPINELTFERYKPNASTWTFQIDLGSAKAADCYCIAAHTLTGATVTLQQFTGSWTTVASVTPADNSPIMFIFEELTKQDWRLSVTGGAGEIGVIMIGAALQMQRPFYQGFSPARMARDVKVLGNFSETNELVGRSRIRKSLRASYTWNNLTYAWVRANLDGTSGLIQSVEIAPCFLAWRPSNDGDVDFLMRVEVTPPNITGPASYVSFSMNAEVLAYE